MYSRVSIRELDWSAIQPWVTLVVSAALLWSLSMTAGAQQSADRSLRDRVRVQVQLGLGYMRSGRKELAQDNLDRALAIDPNSPSAHAAMAIFKEFLGDYKAADAQFHEAIALAPDKGGVRNDYANFLCRRGEYEKADNQFRIGMADRLYATPEVLYVNAGQCAMRKGDLGMAEIYFRKALQRNPVFPQALGLLADVSYKVHRYAAVLDYLGRYRSISHDTPQTLRLAIDTLDKLGRTSEARRLQLELRRKFPAAVLKTTKLSPDQ